MEGETLRQSQKMMAELFDHASDTTGLHLKNIYAGQELEESATAEFFSGVQTEGDRSAFKQMSFPRAFIGNMVFQAVRTRL